MAAPTMTAIAPAPPAAALQAIAAAAAVATTAAATPSLTGSLATTTAAPPSAVPPALDDRLPLFTTHEALVNKIDNRNALVLSVPAESSLLLRLVAPPSHSYEERDLRWLHLLQAIAVVPSRKVDTIAKLAAQALQLVRSPKYKPRLEQALQGLVDVLSKEDSPLSFSQQALLALRLKDQVARFLREWVQDPVEGFVLRKNHVVGGMRLDDVVATPVGAGYLRGYRRDDSCCIVVYPWGHGFIHRRNVEPLDLAIDHERKKRRHNEYLPLEHQHLFEQVESLLENYPPEATGDNDDAATSASSPVVADSIDLEQYRQLLEGLQQEHFDSNVLQQDISFVRRVQALTNKLHKRPRAAQADRADADDRAEVDNDDDEDESEGHQGPNSMGGDESASAMKAEAGEKAELMDVEEHKEEAHVSDEEGLKDGDDEDDPMGE